MKLLAILVLVALAGEPALGQFGKAKAPPRAPATASDVQYILCQVCEAFVKEAIAGVKQLRVEEKPGHMMTESDIIERLEKACSPDESAGEWIRNYDLQEDGTKLKLVDMKESGECEVECRTIARACEKVHEKMDLSDLSEMLWKKEGRSTMTQVVCRDQTGVCNKKAPPLPKDRPVGTPFVKVDPEKLQREKLMRSMKAAGLSGSMYDRESMEKMAAGGGMPGMERDEDDDDDEMEAPGAGFQKVEL